MGTLIKRSRYITSLKEIATCLVRLHKIHEGHWRMQFRYDISAANVNFGDVGPTIAAFTPLVETALQRCPEPNEYTVDAAEVNPAPVPDAPAPSRIAVI